MARQVVLPPPGLQVSVRWLGLAITNLSRLGLLSRLRRVRSHVSAQVLMPASIHDVDVTALAGRFNPDVNYFCPPKRHIADDKVHMAPFLHLFDAESSSHLCDWEQLLKAIQVGTSRTSPSASLIVDGMHFNNTEYPSATAWAYCWAFIRKTLDPEPTFECRGPCREAHSRQVRRTKRCRDPASLADSGRLALSLGVSHPEFITSWILVSF